MRAKSLRGVASCLHRVGWYPRAGLERVADKDRALELAIQGLGRTLDRRY